MSKAFSKTYNEKAFDFKSFRPTKTQVLSKAFFSNKVDDKNRKILNIQAPTNVNTSSLLAKIQRPSRLFRPAGFQSHLKMYQNSGGPKVH